MAKFLSFPLPAVWLLIFALGLPFSSPAVDTDNDGMTDAWEIKFGLNPTNSADALIDSDADGLTNLWEFAAQSDPLNGDTDNDFVPDGADVAPVSRANIQWGNPRFTEGDANSVVISTIHQTINGTGLTLI